MTSALMPAGAIGYDAAGFTGLRGLARRAVSRTARRTHRYGMAAAGPSGFAAMKAAGATWVSLYIGGRFGVSSATIEAAWAAGLAVSPNYERSATLGLGGETAGGNAAIECAQELEALGFQGEANVFFSFVDFSPTVDQYGVLDLCHASAVRNWRPGWQDIGAYGAGYYMNHLDAQDFWGGRPLWYWAGNPQTIQPACSVKQRIAPTLDTSGFGVAVDENVTVQPVRMWTGYGADPPDPINPQEADVATVVLQLADADAVFEAEKSSNGVISWVKWIDGARQAALLGAPFNCEAIPQHVADFAGRTLIGPLPVGDSRHTWTGAEFYRYTPPVAGPPGPPGAQGPVGPAGLPGPKGDPGPAPKTVTFGY